MINVLSWTDSGYIRTKIYLNNNFRDSASAPRVESSARSMNKYLKAQVYLSKNLWISCLAIPPSSHAFANFTLSFSALLRNSLPFSLRHKSIIWRVSIPTASRVPAGTSPFLCNGLRPCPVLTWKSSKAALRFSVRCAAAIGWSEPKGQQILYEKINK